MNFSHSNKDQTKRQKNNKNKMKKLKHSPKISQSNRLIILNFKTSATEASQREIITPNAKE